MEEREETPTKHHRGVVERESRKKMKTDKLQSGSWDRCMQFLPHKQRYCNMARTEGFDYCGVHMNTSNKGERIACPIDPSHTIWSGQMQAHIKVCNIATANKQLAEKPYYQENINSGPSLEVPEESQQLEASALIAKIERLFQTIEPIPNVFLTEDDSVLLPETCSFSEVTKKRSSFQRRRHGLQATSLVAHLQRRGLLQQAANYIEMGAGRGLLGLAVQSAVRSSNNNNQVNNSEGHGLPMEGLPQSCFYLIERSGVRRKADRSMEHQGYYRARVDIRHLNIRGLPHITDAAVLGPEDHHHNSNSDSNNGVKPVIAVAKHLCGVATDLALRSLVSHGSMNEGDDASGIHIGGVAIATCCHHACNMQDYIYGDWLRGECGITAQEFDVMRRWSGWTTLTMATIKKSNVTDDVTKETEAAEQQQEGEEEEDDADDDNGDQQQDTLSSAQHSNSNYNNIIDTTVITQLSVVDKARIGRMIKRIFDHGRVLFLRSLGLQAEIVHYCDEEISPENALIIAWQS